MYQTTSRQHRIDQAKSDLSTLLEDGSNLLANGNINVLATVIGATAFELEQHIKYVADQAILLTADDDNLENIHGKLWQVTRNKATKFKAQVEFTGVDGAIVPINTELQSPAGNLYLTLSETTIVNGVAQVAIESVDDGLKVNLSFNTQLALTQAIDDLNADTTLKNITVLGQDEEEMEDYKNRIQEYINNRNNTGTLADYELWAKQVPGVKQAYARRNINGAGTVGLYIVADSDLTDVVTEHITKLKPVSAELYVVIPEPQAINLNIKIKPYSTSLETKVSNAIISYFNSLEFEESIIATQLNKAISDNPEIEDFTTNAINTEITAGKTAVLGSLVIESLS